MARLTRAAVIDAPVEQVFAFARDVGQLWACLPDTAIRDVRLTPEGVGTSAQWFSKLLGVHIEGRIEYTEVVPDERIVAVSTTGPVWTFTFAPRDGGTEFTLDCEWHVQVPVVGAPLEDLTVKLSEGGIDQMVVNVKARVEGSEAPAQVKARTLVQSVTVDAPVETVFEFASDIGRLWSSHPDMAVRDVTLTPDGVGSSAQWFGQMLGIHAQGHVEYTDVVPGERIVVLSSPGPGVSFTWTYLFAAHDGGTQVTSEGTAHVSLPVVGVAIGNLILKQGESSMQKMLENMKAQVEAGKA